LTPGSNSRDFRNSLAEPVSGNVLSDGRFVLRGLVPGTYILSATLPAGRVLLSATSNGRDLLDDEVTLEDIDITDLTIATSDKPAELSGDLMDRDGRPESGCLILVFPENESLRGSRRRVLVTRPDTAGHFRFTEIPPGTYLMAALAGTNMEEWREVGFLNATATAALKVTLIEGQKTVQNLRLGK
jgi:hypothetical protein